MNEIDSIYVSLRIEDEFSRELRNFQQEMKITEASVRDFSLNGGSPLRFHDNVVILICWRIFGSRNVDTKKLFFSLTYFLYMLL
jgi:hypothetical protein